MMDASRSSVCQAVAAWCLFSPLIWSLPGTPGSVALTVIANAAAVVVLPVLCGSLWYITARTAFIGAAYRNRWWEKCVLAALQVLPVPD
jgi:hypothetical protein